MKRIILILFIPLSIMLHAQEIKTVQDFGVWTGYQLNKEKTDKLSWRIKNELRLFNNAASIDNLFFEYGLKYKLDTHFKMGINLRHSFKFSRAGAFDNNDRIDFNMYYKRELSKPLKFYYRLKFQQTFIDLFNTYTSHGYYKTAYRNKVLLKYKVNKKHRASISSELFRLAVPAKPAYFSKMRFVIGDKIKLNKNALNLALGIERELGTDNPLTFYYTRIVYGFNL